MNHQQATSTPASQAAADRLARAQRAAGAVRFSQLPPRNIDWLWPDRIPLGSITLLVSDPGLGKSLLTLEIAARVTTGRPWPDANDEARMTNAEPSSDSSFEGSPSPLPTPHSALTDPPHSSFDIRNSSLSDSPPSAPLAPSSVLVVSAEDDFNNTVRPRLEALGADLDRVLGIAAVPGENREDIPRAFALSRDLERLRNLLDAMPDCRLVVIDPISAYLGGTSEHSNAEIQALLLGLTAVAREHNVAILAVSHLRKKDGAAIYRTMGSQAFVAASRAGWALCKDPDDEQRRLLLPIKSNLAPRVAGLAFTIETSTDSHSPTIRWSPDPVNHSIDFAFAASRPPGRPDEERQHAIEWLRARLADGPRPSSDIKEEAQAHGIAYRTLYRAFRKLEGETHRHGQFPFGQWHWQLPGVDCQKPGGEFWQSTNFLDELMNSLTTSSGGTTRAPL